YPYFSCYLGIARSFFLLRPHPRSTLFPYTTLFRSVSDYNARQSDAPNKAGESKWISRQHQAHHRAEQGKRNSGHDDKRFGNPFRSEEHTSELQSHLNLVCRLLLEKKKNNTKKY